MMATTAPTVAPAAARLATWVVGMDPSQIPSPVLDAAREHTLDTLGCGLGGLAVGGAAGAGRRVATAAGQGLASVIGATGRVDAAAAALANGMLCHGLDFDDTHEPSICHVGTVVVPAALAMAELQGASGAETLAAIVIGTETTTRVGMAASEGFHRRGFHPTGVCGVFGAAAAACRLRGLDTETTTRAFGLAGSMASGIFAYLADGSQTKPLHAGWAAQAGIQAALLAEAGASGPAAVFEDRYGLYATHIDVAADLASQLDDLGRRWETPRVAFKPYPACHWIHATVDAVAEAAEGLAAGDIERIVARIPEVGVPIVFEPAEAKAAPQTAYDAKFSLPWCVAARVVEGRLDVRSFLRPDVAAPEIVALAARVVNEPWIGPAPRSPFAGSVDVLPRGGEARRVTLDAPRGAPENPMSFEALVAKFLANATLSLGQDEAAELVEAVDDLGAAAGVGAITAPLRAAAPRT